MNRLALRILALIIVGVTTSATAAPDTACQCDYADKASLKVAARKTVTDVASRASHAAHRQLVPLAVRVENTPQLVYFNPKAMEIVVPWWQDVDPAVQGIFAQLAGNPDEGRELFNMLFNRFFIAHEAGHWLAFLASGKKDLAPADLYGDELRANQLAVAYWATTSDGQSFLDRLQGVLEPVLAKLPNPVPAGSSPIEYFNSHYQELGQNPPAYAWFQFRLVLDALAQRDATTFDRLVQSDFNVAKAKQARQGQK